MFSFQQPTSCESHHHSPSIVALIRDFASRNTLNTPEVWLEMFVGVKQLSRAMLHDETGYHLSCGYTGDNI
jgi:hypothetical protein